MLLVANVGNTTIRVGGFEDGDEPVFVERLAVAHLDRLRVPEGQFEGFVLGSVNPIAGAQVRRWAEASLRCPVFELRAELPIPMPILCGHPERVGADRIANAIALHKHTRNGGVVVDFGSAISLAVVSPAGEFLGGAIAPGLAMSARALHAHTALLPLVDPQPPPGHLGRDTEEAISAGLLWGLAGLADRLIEHLAGPWPGAAVVATGTDAPRLVPHCRRVATILPHLTLQGLREAYLRRP